MSDSAPNNGDAKVLEQDARISAVSKLPTVEGPSQDSWPLRMPSGGVISGSQLGYEFGLGAPKDIATYSVAAFVAEVTHIGEAHLVGVPGERPSDGTGKNEFQHDAVIHVRVTVNSVIAGNLVDEGEKHTHLVSGQIHDGLFFEFDEDRLPVIGGRYLMFAMLNRLEDDPRSGGILRITGAGGGRIPLEEAKAQGLLDEAQIQQLIGTNLDAEHLAMLAEAGLFPNR